MIFSIIRLKEATCQSRLGGQQVKVAKINVDTEILPFILLFALSATQYIGDPMAGHLGSIIALFCASFGICGCTKQMVPTTGGPINQAPTPSNPVPIL